jgi:bifunctional enzyme CysN/CysC
VFTFAAQAANYIGRVKVTTANPLFFDPYDRNRETGGFIIIDPHDFRTVGAGMIRHASAGTIEALRRDERAKRLRNAADQADGLAPEAAQRNIHWDPGYVGLEDRTRRNGHRPRVIWFTGLSGAGKSTIAKQLEKDLFDAGMQVTRLDGDNVRHGLNADLGFSRADRQENIRRIGHIARLLYDTGQIVLCTFVSPYKEDRDAVRSLFPEGDFQEVHVKVSLAEARRRDPKGLYAKVDAGEITGFTGVDEPFEAPEQPELTIETEGQDVSAAVAAVRGLVE